MSMNPKEIGQIVQGEEKVKPSLSLQLILTASSDGIDLNQVLSGEEDDSSEEYPSMEMACHLVQRLLDQVSYNDSPPSNEEHGGTNSAEGTLLSTGYSTQSHVDLQNSRKVFVNNEPVRGTDDPSTLWTNHYERRRKPAEISLGHVSFACFCSRALDAFGKPSLPTIEASKEASKKLEEPNFKAPFSATSNGNILPKKLWFRRRKFDVVNSSFDCEGRDDETADRPNLTSISRDSNRLKMFGSEYARFLTRTALAPTEKSSSRITTAHPPRDVAQRKRALPLESPLEEASDAVLSGAVTDIVVTYNNDPPPKGYFRISESRSGERVILGGKKGTVFLNVKKEANWDRAAQRPCVTAMVIIFPERKEFVPPGFCVARLHRPNTALLSGESLPANLNYGGEPVYLCFRRSREQNPVTGIIPLKPSKNESVPEGYTVIEHTPTNHIATLSKSNPVFLAYRQRLANLEPLRPLPLVLSIHNAPSTSRSLKSYYCTGGTVVQSNVGKFHVMDRSTHSLLSPSSISNRLSLIEASRQKSMTLANELPAGNGNTYSYSSNADIPSTTSQGLTSSLLLTHSLSTPSQRSIASDLDNSISSVGDTEDIESTGNEVSSESVLKTNQKSISNYTLSSKEDGLDEFEVDLHQESRTKQNGAASRHRNEEVERCLETLSFIPVVSSVINEKDPKGMLRFQARVALLSPILTACYTRHGGSALIAVEGLAKLLKEDFFLSDVNMKGNSSSNITLLDIAIQSVCDVATTGVQETQLYACVDFVQSAMKYGCGYLNNRTVGYTFRFYLFVFYFGAYTPTAGVVPVQGGSFVKNKFILDDPRSSQSSYLPGGAPQSAALSMKDLVSFSIRRLRSLSSLDKLRNQKVNFPDHSKKSIPENFKLFMDNLISDIVETSMQRVEVANYLELTMQQIHRSGGSELFWYDMINSCGAGLFGDDRVLREETQSMYSLCFTILASLVKVASVRIRRDKSFVPVARDMAGKMLALELIYFFLEQWSESQDSLRVPKSKSASTFGFCIRRLVVPCLLLATDDSIKDPKIFKRVFRIVGLLCSDSHLRENMRLEFGVLFDHFILKFLEIGPQFRSVPKEQEQDTTNFLLDQQVEILNCMSTWVSRGSLEILPVYLNFDARSSSIRNGPNKITEIFLGPQWKICLRLCKSLCAISEDCSNILVKGIRASENRSSTLKHKILNEDQHDAEGRDGREREGAERLRNSAFQCLVSMIKTIAQSAAWSSGDHYLILMDNFSSTKRPTKACCDEDILSVAYNETSTNEVRAEKARVWERRATTPDISKTGLQYVSIPGHQWETESSFFNDQQHCDSESCARDFQGSSDHLSVAFELARNKKISKAIDYLTALGALNKSPRDIASFLRIHKGEFSSKDLGIYLGESGTDGPEAEFWNLVRFYYIRANSFVGMGVEQGLRYFLTNCGFRLPGEAQQIDRIISTFARCYWEDNAGDVSGNVLCPKDQDTVFLLSFAIIMLNTDLHKSHVTSSSRKREHKRMTKTEFLKNLHGVCSSEPLTQDYLAKIYDSIKEAPIALYDEDSSDTLDFEQTLEAKTSSITENVKALDALLRGLAIHQYTFLNVPEQSSNTNNSQRSSIRSLARDFMTKAWHYFHGLINAVLENAHLDLKGMELCFDVLKYVITATICLDMPIERSAFLQQLVRYRVFDAWRRGLTKDMSAGAESIKKEAWFRAVEEGCSQPFTHRGRVQAMRVVYQMMNSIELSFADNVKDLRALKDAVLKLKDGGFLLNDPSRSFLRHGTLIKRSNRSARSTPYDFFLFSDVLIYGRPAGSHSNQITIHESLPLILMKVVDFFPPTMKKESKVGFQLFHPKKNLMVLCQSKEERRSWVNSIRAAIDVELERKVAIEAARRAAADHFK